MENILNAKQEVYDKVVTDIRATNDYSKFKSILGNRIINDKNYRKIIKSMSEKQLLIPILCSIDEDGKLLVIDGQHRLKAITSLGESSNEDYPVYYYVVEGYSIEDVKIANQSGVNWVLEDFLNLHCSLNKEEYLYFKDLSKRYNITTNQLVEMIATFEGKAINLLRLEFEDGLLEIVNKFELETFLEALEDFDFFKESRSAGFTKAFLKLYGYRGYDHKLMKKKIKTLGYKFSKQLSFGNYLSMLVNEIYAFGSSRVSFRYDERNDSFYEVNKENVV